MNRVPTVLKSREEIPEGLTMLDPFWKNWQTLRRSMRVLIAFLLLLPVSGFTCANVDGTTQDGGFRRERVIVQSLRHAIKTNPTEVSARTKFRLNRPETDAQTREYQAVDDMFHGKAEEGLAILRELEKHSPGVYSVASNQGTIYELMGDHENALKWIEEGIRRNATAHDGTEWIHVLILKAKIEAGKHPERTTLPRLLNLPEKVDADSEFTVDGETYTAAIIKDSLYHQMQERLIFVKPKDPYVADLLYSLALLEASLGTLEQAVGILRLAREYGFADEALLTQHELSYQSIINTARFKKGAMWTAITLPILYLLGRHLWKKRHEKWFFWTRRQYKAYLAAKAQQQAQEA